MTGWHEEEDDDEMAIEHLEQSEHSALSAVALRLRKGDLTNEQRTAMAKNYAAQYLCLPPRDFVRLENTDGTSLQSIFYNPSTVTTNTWPVLP